MYKDIFANYKLVTREEYRECNIPENEKRILCEEGLPEGVLPFLVFNTHKNSPVYLEDEAQNGFNSKDIIIGYDYEVPICISGNNEIIEKGYSQVHFINSNLECFLECIAIYLSYGEKLDKIMESGIGQEEERDCIVEQIKQKFNKTDIKALEDEENFWSLILEQKRDGLI